MRRPAAHEVRAAMLGAHRRCAFRILLVLLRIRDVDQRDDIRAHRTPPLNLGSTQYSPPVLGPLVPPPVRPAHRSPPGTIARLRRGRQGSLGLCAGTRRYSVEHPYQAALRSPRKEPLDEGLRLRPAPQVGTLGVHATRRMPPRFPPRKSAATAA